MKAFLIILLMLITIQVCPAQIGSGQSNPTTTSGLTEQTDKELRGHEGALPMDGGTSQTSGWLSRVVFLALMFSVAIGVIVWMHKTRNGFWV